MELALRNAVIVDGAGGERFSGDIGISEGRVVAVGEVRGCAASEIELASAVVAPGFIDVHTHYDAQAFWDPMLSPSSFHGVTTVIAGNCGFTLAPLSGDPADTDYLLRMLARVEAMPLNTLRAALKPTWTDFGSFLAALDGRLAINAVFLVGHSALRRLVMGDQAVGRSATKAEIDAMCALLDRSLAQGGAGFSTTVSYTHSDGEGRPVPSRWASREELLSLAAVLQRHPGTWVEMVTGKTEMEESDHALMTDVALAAGRPLNWNLVTVSARARSAYESQLRASDYAHERGARVHGLVPAMPTKVLMNFITGFLLDSLPGWSEVLLLPKAEKIKALADPRVRRRLESGARRIEAPALRMMLEDWGAITIESVGSGENARWSGRLLADYARAVGRPPIEALFDLAVMEELNLSFSPPVDGDDDESWRMRADAWRDPRLIVGGSDAGAHLDMIDSFALSTQLLGEGVRRRRLIDLERAVELITSVPAARFGLKDRGRIAPGMRADLVVFDPDLIDCGPVRMKFDLPQGEPRLYADALGIDHVIVNGAVAISHGRPTGRLNGQVLRSGQDTQAV